MTENATESAKRNYRVVNDGECSVIELTDEDVDDFYVFRTFTEAKSSLVKHLESRINGLRYTLRTLRQTKKGDVS